MNFSNLQRRKSCYIARRVKKGALVIRLIRNGSSSWKDFVCYFFLDKAMNCMWLDFWDSFLNASAYH